MTLPSRRCLTMSAARNRRSWCEHVVWFILNMRDKSLTHISLMESAHIIFVRVASLHAEKNSASICKVALRGIYLMIVSSVV